jgi:Ca2+-transporting ATPase
MMEEDSMENLYHKTAAAVMKEMHTSRDGLTQEEAQKRLQASGKNRLSEGKRKKPWQVFLEQFQDLLVVILLAAAAISTVSGDAESTAVILIVITLNAALGTWQHEKAQKSLDSLKAMTSPDAKVLRDGRLTVIDSTEVVPGDIMYLEAGDLVSADGRLLECSGLQLDESSLTGESEAVEKCIGVQDLSAAPLAEQQNMVFSGSLITGGRGIAVVTATGMQTEIGRIAAMMNDAGERRTPLQISLDQFSSRLAAGILLICAAVFGISLYRKMPVLDSLMFAVALAVAAIPEALGSIVTIVQAMGTQQMAKEHAIIKDLKAVESLGCVSVICSDKTGTLTRNRMSVQSVWSGGKELIPEQLRMEDPAWRQLLLAAVLASDAAGDSMETALFEMVQKADVSASGLRAQYPQVAEIPFDSERKWMCTLNRDGEDRILYVKGAPDVLLSRADSVQTAVGLMPMTAGWKQRILQKNREWAGQGMRVIAMAYRKLEISTDKNKNLERNLFLPPKRSDSSEAVSLKHDDVSHLVWIGMAAMMDPPRPETRAAVQTARRAGIRTVMITGDHRITAQSIARRIGIFREGDEAVTGMELDAMSDAELLQRLDRISVYARVSPAHKIRIVEAWQNRGHIVAMTGDGVNDAPALKKADIGVAMGQSGTEVSRDAASMILTDDNFATIIKAVSNGRNVYRNICHAIEFLLSGNIAGILCVLYTSFMALPMPFAPVHLLFINLLTDSLPAIAIGMEPQEEGLLDQPPRDPNKGILTRPFLKAVTGQGILIAVCTMLAYHSGLADGGIAVASTMAFSTLTLARLFHGFNCRSERPVLWLGLLTNRWTVMAFETGAVLLAAVLFLPGLQQMFSVADLNRYQFLAVAVLAFLPTVLIQIGKTVREVVK